MKKLIVLIIICSFLVSCGLNSNTSKSKYTKFDTSIENKDNIKYLDVSKTGDNVSYSILNQEGEIETGFTYYLKENSLEKFINIANFIDTDMEYTLLTFVNFEQVNYEVEDETYNSFTALIAQNSDIQIPIKINNLNAGINDIIFLIILNPNKNLPKSSDNIKFEDVLYLRCNAILGDDKIIKEYEYTDVSLVNGAERPVLLQEKRNNSMFELTSYDQELNKSKEAIISVGNRQETEEEYAVILLVDWKPVPISKKNVIYIKLDAKSTGLIPIDISIDEAGLHKIVAITIKKPYHYEDFRSIDVASSQWVIANALEP